MAHIIRPYGGINTETKDMVRYVALEHDSAPENADVVTSTLAALRRAIEERDVFKADREVRELGAAEGFSTRIVTA